MPNVCATAATPNSPNSVRFHFYCAPLVIEMRSLFFRFVLLENNEMGGGGWKQKVRFIVRLVSVGVLASAFHNNNLQTQMDHFMNGNELTRCWTKVFPKMAQKTNDFRKNGIPHEKFSFQSSLYCTFFLGGFGIQSKLCCVRTLRTAVNEQNVQTNFNFTKENFRMIRSQKKNKWLQNNSWWFHLFIVCCEKSPLFAQITQM